MPQQYFYAGGGDPYSAIAGQQRAWDDDLRGDQRFEIQQRQQADAIQRQMAERQAQYDFQLASESRQQARREQEQAVQFGREERATAENRMLNNRNFQLGLEQQRYERANAERKFGFDERAEQSRADVLDFNRQQIFKQQAMQRAERGDFPSADAVMQAFPQTTSAEQDEAAELSERRRQEMEAQWRFAQSVADAKKKQETDLGIQAAWNRGRDATKPNDITDAQRAVMGGERFTASRRDATKSDMDTRAEWLKAVMQKNPNLIREEGDEMVPAMARPWWLESAAPSAAPRASVPVAAPVASRVTTQAQFDAVPSGATYTGRDGRTYRKP